MGKGGGYVCGLTLHLLLLEIPLIWDASELCYEQKSMGELVG